MISKRLFFHQGNLVVRVPTEPCSKKKKKKIYQIQIYFEGSPGTDRREPQYKKAYEGRPLSSERLEYNPNPNRHARTKRLIYPPLITVCKFDRYHAALAIVALDHATNSVAVRMAPKLAA